MYMQTHVHINTHTHTHTHTNIHANTYTHMNIHTVQTYTGKQKDRKINRKTAGDRQMKRSYQLEFQNTDIKRLKLTFNKLLTYNNNNKQQQQQTTTTTTTTN